MQFSLWRIWVLLAATSCFGGTLIAQVGFDSTRLWNQITPEENTNTTIDNSDIATNTGGFFKTDKNDNNEQIIVITGEFINRLNYNTLGDVLKDLPQFAVNQPGSGLQGEVFYSAGLNGNENCAILINGVPIHTFFSAGFPLAGNLPIRQAQRIEIILNPATARYGSGATLGVINIITPQTERPVYIKASINGMSNSSNNLSLLVGGKFGKGRNTVRFDVYGNFLKFSNIRLNSDTQIYSIHSYRSQLYPYFNNTNYKQLPPDNGPVEHESDLTGLNVYYRNFHFLFHSSNRKDQASNGLNPMAMYRDIANFFVSDRQLNFAISYDAKKKHHRDFFQSRFSYYKIQTGSAAKYIFPGVKQAGFDYLIERLKGTVPQDSITPIVERNLRDWDENYFDQVRFLRGGSVDIVLNYLRQYEWKNFFSSFGYSLTVCGGSAINKYTRLLENNIFFNNDSAYSPNNIGKMNAYLTSFSNFVVSLGYRYKSFDIEFRSLIQNGNNVIVSNQNFYSKAFLMPSVKISYKRNGGKQTYYFNYSTGMDMFNPTRLENQYRFNIDGDNLLEFNRNFALYGITEKKQVTLGIRNSYLFYSKTTGIPLIGFYDDRMVYSKTATPNTRYYGNYTVSGSMLQHYGITLISKDFSTAILNSTLEVNPDSVRRRNQLRFGITSLAMFSFQRFTLPKLEGVQKTNYFTPANRIRLNFYISKGKNWVFTTLYNYTGKTRPSFYYDVIVPNKHTFDMMFHYSFSKQFSANLKWFNITGRDLYGPQATGSVDDLYLQPQRYQKFLIT
ncbi:MAG: TonB-dependent receptor plug domain-containing protein, partial [Bacteroidia bacterium]|nr:TonB-dependent receptor plug domain-containing protein [Bacteroidia bacterium]